VRRVGSLRPSLSRQAIPRLFVASLGLSAVATIAVAVLVRPSGVLPVTHEVLLGIAGAALGLAVACGLVMRLRPWPARLDALAPPRTRSSILLALAAWFPLLVVPAYLAARSTFAPTVEWNRAFGFMDKRWETSLYTLGTLAPILLLLGSARLLEVEGGARARLGALLRGAERTPAVPPPDLRLGTVFRIAGGVLTAAALAYYFFGPPWHLERNAAPIDYHEDVHLGAFQAISRGDTPYIGPAAVQYGPGAQLLEYLYMRHVGGFSVVGMRESFALFHWAGATVFLVALFLRFRFVQALATSLLAALIYPTLQLFGFSSSAWEGFFGWANLLRYTGVFLVVFLLPGVVDRLPSRRGVAAGLVLGFAWGVLSFVAQENLIGGAVGAVALLLALLFSRTASLRRVVLAAGAVAAGFVLAWLPVLVYYAHAGVLRRFLSLYLFVPRAVAKGYTNTSFLEGLHSPWGRTFYVFPFVLALVALLCVLRFRPLRPAVSWSSERTLLVATVVTTSVLFQSALLRSDTTHLIGAMLAVPAFVVAAATLLPGRLGARRRPTVVLAGAAILCCALVLVPRTQWSDLGSRLESPYEARGALARQPPVAVPASLAAERVGPGLEAAPVCCTGSSWSTPQFVRLMNQIHQIVGGRTTYVASFRDGYPGLVYFAADLRPAPIPLEPYTMVLTTPQMDDYLYDFKVRVAPATQALLTYDLGAPEALEFVDVHPDHTTQTLDYRGTPYYVLLAG
jgi:hypothetical protein